MEQSFPNDPRPVPMTVGCGCTVAAMFFALGLLAAWAGIAVMR